MSIVVDLPAPLGPSSATVSPAAIDTSMPRTARIGPSGPAKDLTRPLSSMLPGPPVAGVAAGVRPPERPSVTATPVEVVCSLIGRLLPRVAHRLEPLDLRQHDLA